jgi:two-component system phosphate regulon sensor histidine kinase PhoR
MATFSSSDSASMFSSKNKFRNNLLSFYSAIFLIVALLVITYYYQREKQYKVSTLNDELENITSIVNNYININSIYTSGQYRKIDSLSQLLPHPNLRITIIDTTGMVLYDSFVHEYDKMENHRSRPEVVQSAHSGFGTAVRKSGTTGQEFYYYAKFYKKYYIRAALVYDVNIAKFMKANLSFLIIMLF